VAEYFNVDPVIVRIAAVVLLFSGPGLFAYGLAWIFVPEAKGPARHDGPQAPIDHNDRGTQIFGVVLLALAISVLWGDWWSPATRWLFPLGLMALGAWLLLRRDANDEDGEAIASPPPPPPPPTPSPDVGGTSDDATILSNPSAPPVVADGDASGGAPLGAPWDVPPAPSAPPEPPASRRRRRMLGPIVFGTLLVWAGLAVLTDVSVETGLAGALLIVGVGFVLGSFIGGSRALILPALAIGGALAVMAVVDIPLSGPVGEQGWAPQSVAEVEDLYDVSIGEGTVDLTAIRPAAGDEVAVEASVGIGHLVVVVPADVALEVTSKVGTGESDVLGRQQGGVGITANRSAEGSPDRGTLLLDLQVGVGHIEVQRTSADTDEPLRQLGWDTPNDTEQLGQR